MGWYLPTTVCGILILIAALLTLSLPETSAGHLADHIEEVPSSTSSSATSSVDEHSKDRNTKDRTDKTSKI